MRAAIYAISDGAISRFVTGPPDHVHLQLQDGEEFYLNCPPDATHIINDEPVIIPPDPPTLEEVKVFKLAEINQARDRQELAGFEYLGKMFDSDDRAMKRIGTAVGAAQVYPAFTVEWTCADNSTITLNAEQMLFMPVAMAQYGNSLHVKARALKDLVNAAVTVGEVEVINW